MRLLGRMLRPVWQRVRVRGVVILLTIFVWLLLPVFHAPFIATAILLGVFMLELLVMWYLSRVAAMERSLVPTPLQLQAQIIDSHVEDAAMLRAITELMEHEDTILDITRRSFAYALKLCWLPMTAAIGCFIMPAIVGAIPFKVPHDIGTNHPYTTTSHISIWLPFILMGILLLLICPLRTLRWHYTYLFFTNMGIHIATLPPSWLPWMIAPRPFLPWDSILTANNIDTGFGNMFNYGGVDLATLIPKESISRDYDPVKWVPRHRYYVMLINRHIRPRFPRPGAAPNPQTSPPSPPPAAEESMPSRPYRDLRFHRRPRR